MRTHAKSNCADSKAARSPSASSIAAAQPFEPRCGAGLEGVLVAARVLSLPRAELEAIALEPLTALVRLATDWPTASEEIEARVGDYRFLIVEFRSPHDLSVYAQIWSEPDSELIMEVGPGPRDDLSTKTFTDRVAPALAGRGFLVGGNAHNFRKRLPVSTAEDPLRIAHELLSLVVDVMGYDGQVDLAYQLRQSTFLKASYVTSGITCSGLRDLLKVWGLHATPASDNPASLDAHSHGFDFRIQLFAPLQGSKETFWEIHLSVAFEFPRERAPDLIREVNDKLWLVKAGALKDSGDPTIPVRLAYGINLAGGVTLGHIKSQIFEWLDNVRHLWTTWRTPVTAAIAAPSEASPRVVH